MPIRIPDALPAAAQLESENIFVMTEYRALHQDIRPLRVLILNLMPTKIATETQIMRTPRCTFVGARRPVCTIITVSRSMTCRQRQAACSSIIW